MIFACRTSQVCRLIIACFVCLAAAGAAAAQTADPATTRPAEGILDRAPRIVVLRDATIVPAPGRVIENGTVVIEGSRITAVDADAEIPAGAEVISLKGKRIYAGLIDASAHPTPVAASASAEAAHWNPYVTPHHEPQLPAATESIGDAEALRNQGITVRLLAPDRGIFSGSSHAVLTGGPQTLSPVIKRAVFQHFQLTVPRSNTRPVFPRSPMGATALVRQTLLDVRWYQQAWRVHESDPRVQPPELDSVSQLLGETLADGRFCIDCPNERFVGRADRVAREFSADVVLRGSGREYRMLDSAMKAGRPMLIPVAFPKPPKAAAPEDAERLSLSELLHWYFAPENPQRLAGAGVRFALTTADLEKTQEFLPAVRTAVQRGLAPEAALAALTTVPAEILGIQRHVGTIEAGKLANLAVVSDDLFADKAVVEETWVAGRRYRRLHETAVPFPHDLLVGRRTVRLARSVNGVRELTLQISSRPTRSDQPAKWSAQWIVGDSEPDSPEADEQPDKQDNKTEVEEGEKKKGEKKVSLDNLVVQHDRLSGTFRGEKVDSRLPAGVARLSLLILRKGAPSQVDDQEESPAADLSGEIVWPDGRSTAIRLRREPDTDEAAADKPEEEPQADEPPPDDKATDESAPEKTPDDAPATDKAAVPARELAEAVEPFLRGDAFRRGGNAGDGAVPQPAAVLFRGATVWTGGPDGILEQTDVLVEKGRIVRVGRDLELPPEYVTVDARGRHLTPGLIDCHSHIATDGGINEATRAVTADVRIGDFIDHSDIAVFRQLAGGVTAANILHGSANPIGGQNRVIKFRWGADPDELTFTAAPPGIKFALGENVKRDSWRDGSNPRYPQTRMGVEQLLRDRFIEAREYDRRHRDWEAGIRTGLPPRRDLRLEALAEVLRGRRWIHCHSYRQDEIAALLEVLQEFNVQIATLQHVLEGYKIAEILAEHGAAASTFSDWWAYKVEAFDAVPYNAAVLQQQGINVSINSDDAELGRRLNTEAAKAVKYGGVDEAEALKMVTLNPAIQLRIDDRVGSIEPGKDADLVLWSGSPLSPMSRCEETWIDGRRYYSREAAERANAEIAEVREMLIQRVLAGDDKPPSEDSKDPSDDADRPKVFLSEEDRWPRVDIYCAARRALGLDAGERQFERTDSIEEQP